MARTHSPLRYPGGKSSLQTLIGGILKENGLARGHYAEPYAGGASLALALLFSGQVSDIHLNDVDAGIWAFWHTVLTDPAPFLDLVQKLPITIDEWHRQRSIYKAGDPDDPLSLGFATFFLNRTNRSGIIGSGGVIGGLDQTGNYKLDCRFNREELSRRIQRIFQYRSRIHFYREDALKFLDRCVTDLPTQTFLAIDPPYYGKGSSLYTSFYTPSDHRLVSKSILDLPRPWILTYDAAPEICALYKDRRQYLFDINYSVQVKRLGTELLVVSKGLRLPEEVRARQTHRPQYRTAA
jgi:DNA adenine methylase